MGNTRKFIFMLSILALSVTSGLFAFGSREVPQIQIKTPSPWYLSPTGTSKTAVHTASVTFSVKMSMKSKTGYIPKYSVSIEGSNGKVVRDIVKRQSPDLGFFSRLFSARKSFTLEKSITWDGKNNSGTVVPDGRYSAKLTVIAQDGTRRSTELGTFVVDTQPPSVTLAAPGRHVFNPSGNGDNSTFKIDQTDGTLERLWTGTFYNSSGKAVRTYTWKNSAPKSFSWDGRDNSGRPLPDGTYVYRITSTDQAGNQSPNYQIGGIVISRQKTPVSLKLSNPYFSPNGDGIKDTTAIELSTKSKLPAISWTVSVANPSGGVVRSFAGQGQFPTRIEFDGKSASGTTLPNASYTVTFDATFQNGNLGEATAQLVLNTTKPLMDVTYSNPAFSPNGDGNKDTTTATLSLKSGEPVESWHLQVKNSEGALERSVTGTGTPPSQVVFDGRSSSGQTLPDGTYTGTFDVTLADGMSNSVSRTFVIETTPPKVALSVSSKIFMPNGTGSNNTETISYTSNRPVTWTGELVNNQHQVLLKTQRPMSMKKVVLTKANPDVANAPAGLYVLNLTFEDNAGNTYSPPPADISLFTHPIRTTITVSKSGFSPRASSGSNTIAASLSTDTPSGIDRYTVDVVNGSGNSVAGYTMQGGLQKSFIWNGTAGPNSAHSYPPDGDYRFRLTTHYTNGLSTTGQSQPFLVDVNPPKITGSSRTTAPFIVTQGGKDVRGSVAASLTITDPGRTITSWTAQLIDPAGGVVKKVSGSGSVSRRYTIDGELPLSGPVPTAVTSLGYQARVTATDQYGNRGTATIAVPLRTIGRVQGGRIHLLVPHILFGPYKYALDSKSASQGKANEQILSLVAEILKSYPSYNVEVDGYSMEIYKRGSRYYNEEENIIVPLSKNRADIARTSLEQLGVASSRIVARYWGGRNTLVDPHNVELRWKNRRVEFILLPKGTPAAVEPPALIRRFDAATNSSAGH